MPCRFTSWRLAAPIALLLASGATACERFATIGVQGSVGGEVRAVCPVEIDGAIDLHIALHADLQRSRAGCS